MKALARMFKLWTALTTVNRIGCRCANPNCWEHRISVIRSLSNGGRCGSRRIGKSP